MTDLPWTKKTRQEQGLVSEASAMKERGARVHPRSGAGSIKDDGSDDEHIYEHKLAARSHTLKGQDLHDLYKRSVLQGKDAVYIVEFDDYRIRLVGHFESY